MRSAREYAELFLMPGWRDLGQKDALVWMEETVKAIINEAYEEGFSDAANQVFNCDGYEEAVDLLHEMSKDFRPTELPIKPCGDSNDA